MLPPPLGNVGRVYHVHRPHLWGKPLLSIVVRRPGLLLVVAIQPHVFVFGSKLACLLEPPTIPVDVIGWPFGGAMNLARAVEYPVQTGRALGILFKWLFPLTGFIASESGIYCRILIAVAANATLLLISTCLATFVLGIRITRVL